MHQLPDRFQQSQLQVCSRDISIHFGSDPVLLDYCFACLLNLFGGEAQKGREIFLAKKKYGDKNKALSNLEGFESGEGTNCAGSSDLFPRPSIHISSDSRHNARRAIYADMPADLLNHRCSDCNRLCRRQRQKFKSSRFIERSHNHVCALLHNVLFSVCA